MHTVATAYELGWTELAAAESEFDVLITTDKNLRYQQNLVARRLAILVLPTTNWLELRRHEARIAAAISTLKSGDFVEFKI